MADEILYEKRSDGVALITLNRPDSLNALAREHMEMLQDAVREAEDDSEVRCVAITGAGRAFSAGGDTRAMQSRTGKGYAQPGMNVVQGLDYSAKQLRVGAVDVTSRLYTMPKPTVALVNGVAVGAGLGITLACDLRLCSDKARFGTAFKNVGASGDYGVSFFLPRLVGSGLARELLFTAEILDAQRALELHIANRIYEHDSLMTEGLAFCAELAAGPTIAYGRMKDNLRYGETATLPDLVAYEAFNQRICFMTDDNKEAVAAFIEKRAPKFVGG